MTMSKPGERLVVGGRQIAGEVLGAHVAQDPLAVPKLGLETGESSAGEVLVQIGDDTDHVGKSGAGVEGASSLVVDQDVIQVLGVDPGGERDDHGAEQFTLPGAGGARRGGHGARR